MKIIVTKEQLNILRENNPKEFNCDKCDNSWTIKPKDKYPYFCHICGYDTHKKKCDYDKLEDFWKNHKKDDIVKENKNSEEVSEKYKNDIATLFDITTPEIKNIIGDENITIKYDLKWFPQWFLHQITVRIVNDEGQLLLFSYDKDAEIMETLHGNIKYMGLDSQVVIVIK